MQVFVVYKTFSDWPTSHTPVAAYTNVTDAVRASDKLMEDRTNEDKMNGIEYYTDLKGVPVYDKS